MTYSKFESPIGTIYIQSDDEYLYSLSFKDWTHEVELKNTAVSQKVSDELEAYFQGKLKNFSIPTFPKGTEFQLKVWNELSKIPFGQTTHYQAMAKRLGDINSIRAAALANGKNPIAIIIPCHRVIGKDGSLTGYSGELWRKQWLLDHEAKTDGTFLKLF